jgi:tetratricopeptide (TPR) repeat protein
LALLIVLAGFLAYSNSLFGPMVFDDRLSIVENVGIRSWSHPGSLLIAPRELPTAGRPLVNLSFAINYAAGGLDVFGYHVANLMLHLATALLIMGVVRRTLALPTLNGRLSSRSSDLAFAIALLWAVHPLTTDAVTYLTQRTEVMSGLCYLGALYAAIRAAESGSALWSAAAVIVCAAGMACKESMASAPVMIAVYDRIFLFSSWKEAGRRRQGLYAGLAGSWLILAALLWSGPRIHSAGFLSGVSPWNYLLDQSVMISRYLRLAIWPSGLVLTYGWPFPVTLSDVLPYAMLILSLIAVTVFALFRNPRWGFLGVWFFATLAPTSSIVPIATEVGAERRMYLPLVAIVTCVVLSATLVSRASARAAAVLLTAVALALGAATWVRNADYASALVLARSDVERRPSPVARYMFGAELLRAGRYQEGVEQLRKALPGAPSAHRLLGAELFREGKPEEAIAELQEFLREQPLILEAVGARQMLGQAFAAKQRWEDALEQYETVLRMNPSLAQRIDTQGLMASVYLQKRSFAEASAQYAEYLGNRPSDARAQNQFGIALIGADNPSDAARAFQRAVAIEPDNADYQRNLANALFYLRNADEAEPHAERAVALDPAAAGARDVLARVLAVKGELARARAELEEALRIDPAFTDAREDLRKLDGLITSRIGQHAR